MARNVAAGTRAAVGKGQGAGEDPGAAEETRAAVGRDPVAAEETGGGRRAARPRPTRGLGLSDSRRRGESDADEELKEDDSARPDSTGDAWSDQGESQFGSNELHGQGMGFPVAVPVEPPAVWHTSWEAWQTYLAEYCERTLQVLPVRETMSRAERNKRLSKTKKGGDESQLVPEGLDPYSRVYICTHGWKKRKSRGSGKRPKQHIRLTGCLVRFVVQWNLDRMELQVKNGFYVHNHAISPAGFATYPSSRGVVNPLVGARVEGMLAVGAKRSKIYDYLLEHDQNVIQVDVDNMVREHASSVATVDDNDATAQALASFAAADPENVSVVAETGGGETGVISLATAHMRRIYGRFSELLLVDCSHKTNRCVGDQVHDSSMINPVLTHDLFCYATDTTTSCSLS
jgi:hypothetical protein